jgi:hypothetical protein
MEQRKNQTGFGTVGILLIVLVVVAVLGVSGFLVYQRHNKPSSTKNNAATSTTQTSTQPNNTTTTQTQTTTTQYLTITQWGVKIPLSSEINDAYYTPSVGSSVGADKQPNTMLVGLKSLDSSGCTATNTTAIALIFRALPTETDSATGKLLTQEYPNGVTLGNYFYAYQNLNSTSCKASASTIQSVDSAFTTAVKGIVPATN